MLSLRDENRIGSLTSGRDQVSDYLTISAARKMEKAISVARFIGFLYDQKRKLRGLNDGMPLAARNVRVRDVQRHV